jgi:hypothetical protein
MSQAMSRGGAIIFADLIGKLDVTVQVRAFKSVAENQETLYRMGQLLPKRSHPMRRLATL